MILFRTDAGPAIGTGHVTRCLALGRALVARGEAVHFAIRQSDGNASNLIAQHSMPFDVIDRDADDIAATRAIVERLPALRFIVVDHYGLDHTWEGALARYARSLLAIDDLVRPHACTHLLDQNFTGDEPPAYASQVPASAHQLLGPHYALLHPEFAAARARRRPLAAPLRNILVSIGGADPTNEAAKVIEAFRDVPGDVAVRVVAGPLNQRFGELLQAASGDSRVTVIQSVRDMAETLAEADLAIGAVGATTSERFSLGVPSLLVTVAANQQPTAARLARAGYVRLLGHGPDLGPVDYTAALVTALAEPEPLLEQAKRASALVDGRGADRVAAIMLGEAEP